MTLWTRLREIARNLAVEPRRRVSVDARPLTSKPVAVSETPVRDTQPARKVAQEVAQVLPTGIKAANEAINALPNGNVPYLPPVTHRKTGAAGIALMHSFEGCEKRRPDGRFEAYLCPAKVWTIGWGSTGKDPFNGGNIRKGTVWTQEQCDMRFEQHLAQFEEAVRARIGKAPTSQAQFDAMVSLTYNIGPAAFARSTVLRRHVAGDFPGAAKAFLMWNKAGGKILRGLTRRREAEAALYRKGS